ncbi:MAG: hypothetical protein ABEJ83_04905 [Candidatus Nanohaloarchaea archaeon]
MDRAEAKSLIQDNERPIREIKASPEDIIRIYNRKEYPIWNPSSNQSVQPGDILVIYATSIKDENESWKSAGIVGMAVVEMVENSPLSMDPFLIDSENSSDGTIQLRDVFLFGEDDTGNYEHNVYECDLNDDAEVERKAKRLVNHNTSYEEAKDDFGVRMPLMGTLNKIKDSEIKTLLLTELSLKKTLEKTKEDTGKTDEEIAHFQDVKTAYENDQEGLVIVLLATFFESLLSTNLRETLDDMFEDERIGTSELEGRKFGLYQLSYLSRALGVITPEEYEKIDNIRSKRNEFAHSLSSWAEEDVEEEFLRDSIKLYEKYVEVGDKSILE